MEDQIMQLPPPQEKPSRRMRFVVLPGGRTKRYGNRFGGEGMFRGKRDPLTLRRKAQAGPKLKVTHMEPGILGFDVIGVKPNTPLAAAIYSDGDIMLRFQNGRKATLSLSKGDEMAIAV